jgi:CRISPR-associated endonuclease/helicase Cas3
VRQPDLLAHSAPSEGRGPQTYDSHVFSVQQRARENAIAMLRFTEIRPGLLEAIEVAAAFHDLGKLDPENQAVLRQGHGARLPWDHIDAGVAHLSHKKNWMAAWLVRAHHAPGLPSRPQHFDPDGLGRRLRGCRHDDADEKRHAAQIKRTDEQLSAYLAAQSAAMGGAATINQRKAIGGLTMRLALSCLVDADHTDTARFTTGFDPQRAPEPRWNERLLHLDAYVGGLPLSGSAERNQHRKAFYDACRNAEISEPTVACEGPVGVGKTTAVAAYLIRRASSEMLRRLIIVAPYTNIISQTVEVLRNALTLPDENPEEIVVEHHHRADFESLGTRELAVLWRAPIIVTTAVQFFETLASNFPGRLRKFHAVPGSAVFIDEAHAALPAHLWPQNWRWLRELADQWSCRLVFASGSLARFWENPEVVGEPIRLPELFTPELKHSILKLERRRVAYVQAGLFPDAETLIQKVRAAPGPRLVIMNTVQSAAVVARRMRQEGETTLHLSTALAPKDRAPIIGRVKEMLKVANREWTLVATSCVEAGVEFSFRTAFRERFSTASLIQVGGRVNRHDEYANGIVHDFLVDQGGGITKHPAARFPAAVLARQFQRGALSGEGYDPAALVTAAMADEIRDRDGLGHDALSENERDRDYPRVARYGQVIDADTRLVVIDPILRDRLAADERVSFHELLVGSVQIWATRIEKLGLEPIQDREDVFWFPYAYDPLFLGYMAGLLQLKDIEQRGFVIA